MNCEEDRYTVRLDVSVLDPVTATHFSAEYAGINESDNLVLHPLDINEKETGIRSIEVCNLEQKDINVQRGLSPYSANIYTDNEDTVENISIETLRKWNRPWEYQIYGGSDDLVYVRGATNKEFSARITPVILELVFDDGDNLQVEVIYNSDEEWTTYFINEQKFAQNSSIRCGVSTVGSILSNMFCSYSDLFCVGSYKPVKEIRKM